MLAVLEQHKRYLDDSGEEQRRTHRRAASDIQVRLRELLLQRALRQLPRDEYDRLVDAVARRAIHPAQAVRTLLETLGW